MIETIKGNISGVITALLVPAVTGIFAWVKTRFKREKAERESLKQGVLAMLHSQLYQTCRAHIAQKWITVEDMKEVEYLYRAYSNLGGNGTGTELYERCKKLPIKGKEGN